MSEFAKESGPTSKDFMLGAVAEQLRNQGHYPGSAKYESVMDLFSGKESSRKSSKEITAEELFNEIIVMLKTAIDILEAKKKICDVSNFF